MADETEKKKAPFAAILLGVVGAALLVALLIAALAL